MAKPRQWAWLLLPQLCYRWRGTSVLASMWVEGSSKCMRLSGIAHRDVVLFDAGFEADGLYPEYSTDFSDGEHFALRGSSPYTHPSCIRPSFRNFYQSMYPYVAAKFRMVIEV